MKMENVYEAFSQSNWMSQLVETGNCLPQFNNFVAMYYSPFPIYPSYFNLRDAKIQDRSPSELSQTKDGMPFNPEEINGENFSIPENKNFEYPGRGIKDAKVEENQIPSIGNLEEASKPAEHRPNRPEKNKKIDKENDQEIKQTKKKNTKDKSSLLSFISNRLVKFVSEMEASRSYVVQILLDNQRHERNLLATYYKYAKEISVRLKNQTAIYKIRELWTGPSGVLDQERKFFHFIIRCLSRVYLQRKFNTVLFQSERFNKQKRVLYMQMKECLLLNLEHPNNFKSYKQFF